MANVLVIEDEAAQRSLMCRYLEKGGHECGEAGSGPDGLDAMTHTRFDLVICDMCMPVQDGIDTIQQIRELDAGIPILGVSGFFGAEGFSGGDLAVAMGADAALHKPFRMQQLLTEVEGMLGRRAAST